MINPKISVVMPVFLGEYPGCATNRDFKFKRAVTSFMQQTFKEAELIIVGDGCELSKKIYETHYAENKNISFYLIDKQPVFSGAVRNEGLKHAKGEWVCYLDSDDYIGFNHLDDLAKSIDNIDADWVYYDDYLVDRNKKIIKRISKIKLGGIGTSSIIHRSTLSVKWGDGYNHDFSFINNLLRYKYKKIESMPEYFVCHMPNVTDV